MKLKINLDGKNYEVDVEVAEPEAPAGIRYGGSSHRNTGPTPSGPAAAPAGDVVEDETKVCRSPLAGVVSKLGVAPGDKVEDDQEVIVLEAMKMFTAITSPKEGVVKAVNVGVGDAVKQGQVLIEFE